MQTKATLIGFTDFRQLEEYQDLHPTLKDIVVDTLHLWPKKCPFLVTCIGRTLEEDGALGASGIHAAGPPWRALDFRILVFGDQHQEVADDLAEEVNARWVYDPERPHLKVLLTAPHGTGPHGHLQVHEETQLR
jgi:hypothetical protein